MATLNFDAKDIVPLAQKLGLGGAPENPGPAEPAAAPPPAPLTPEQLPPVPAQAGFNAWSDDPKNQKKIADGIQAPGTPLVPPAAAPQFSRVAPMAPAAAPAAAPPPTQAADMAANPGAYQKNSIVGRGWGRALAIGGIGALQSLASGLTKGGDPLKGIDYVNQQVEHDQGVPAANAGIYDVRNIKPLRDAAALADTASQTNERNALGAKAGAIATNVPVTTQLKRNATLAQIAKSGQMGHYDEEGNLTVTDDPNSQVAKSRQLKDQLVQAQVDSTNAQKELRDATAAFEKAKTDPNSPLFRQTSERLAIAQRNSEAATTRATAYMGNYMMHSKNLDMQGNVLPGAPLIADDNGQQTVVGSTNANLAAKSQSNAAQFNDVHGALDQVEAAAKGLVGKGGSLNSPSVAAALAQPAGTLNQWLQGEGIKANLTPEERTYVQAIAGAHENVMALRKSAGGSATDAQAAKLDAMIPGASTPDLNYLLGQTGQIRSTAERLGKGATTAAGGLTVRGQQKPGAAPPAAAGAPTEGTRKKNSSGDPVVFHNGQWGPG